MALFGQLTTPQKELPLIDIGNADIMMELLEELAISVATYDWIKNNQPHHPEAKEIEEQALDVYSDFIGILKGQVSDKRINGRADWTSEDLKQHLQECEQSDSDSIIEETVNRFLDVFLEFSRQTKDDGTGTMSRKQYYAFMAGWAHYLSGQASNANPPTEG